MAATGVREVVQDEPSFSSRIPPRAKLVRAAALNLKATFTCPVARSLSSVLLDYHLRRSEVRALATVGTFRIGDVRHGHLERLRGAGLIRAVALLDHRHRTVIVTPTGRSRELLETHRSPSAATRQTFYAGGVESREPSHDAQLYRAYAWAAERLRAQGARIDQCPGFRIENERADQCREVDNVEVTTVRCCGIDASGKVAAGFIRVRGSTGRVGGASADGANPPFDPHTAEEPLR